MANLPTDEQGNLIVRIGHSPDPDDAFMFHAMTTNAFPTPGYNFVHELQDIETLNHRAMNCELEVSAVSIHAYPDIAEELCFDELRCFNGRRLRSDDCCQTRIVD